MRRIAGVLLAAGGSSRFGQPKQMLEWEDTPLVAHMADVALAAGLEPVVAVLGSDAEEVSQALADRPIQQVMNWHWEEGLSTSVHAGLAALPPDVVGAIFLPCDQPLVSPHLLRQLIARFEEGDHTIIYPIHKGQRATPVLFGRSLFPELAGVTGDQGGRVLIARYPEKSSGVEVEDPLMLTDVDTPETYRRLIEETASRQEQPDPESGARRLQRLRHLIIDMDGVLWRGNEPMEGLIPFFSLLRERDIRFILATNNASKRPDQYVERLARFGVEVPQRAILTSGLATAAYLASVAPPGTPVHVLGAEGLRDALVEQGFELVEEGARYVTVGWTQELTWRKLATAALQIRRGATFIGTNPDVTFPSEEGLVPGNGATLAALEAATGVPPLVIGKPEPWLYREGMQRMGAEPETTAVIGDRLDTDIAGGIRTGILTILLLSGIATEEDLASAPVQPDLVYQDIEALRAAWVGDEKR